MAALDICSKVFASHSAFEDLNIYPYGKNITQCIPANSQINEVLFEYYDINKKPFYIERECDNDFTMKLNQFGIWVYGPSGCGKSNLIVRNLLNLKKEFIQINLAPCIGQDVVSFFKEILYEISSKVEGVHSKLKPRTFSECSKALISLLNRYYHNKELIIFIEEIPISTDTGQKEFSQKIFSIIISKTFTDGLSNIKFVLSSIQNPISHIPIFQQKIYQHINFFPLAYWCENEMNSLLNMITDEFNLVLKPEFRTDLLKNAKGSPRFIKKFFRSIYTLGQTDDKTLRTILKDTERELSFK